MAFSRRTLFKLAVTAPFAARRAKAGSRIAPRTYGITYHPEFRFDPESGAFNTRAVIRDLEQMRALGVTLVRADTAFKRVKTDAENALGYDRWFVSQAKKNGYGCFDDCKEQRTD